MPSLRKTSSKGPLYLLSRSRIRKRTPWSEKSRPRLRACWVTQAPVGLRGAAGEPDAPAAVGDEEQRVVAAQEHALDGEEIARDDARRLRVQELAPARPAAPRRRLQSRSSEKTADAGRRHPEAELAQLAADPPMAPARILAREPQHQLPNLSRQAPAVRAGPAPAATSGDERSMPTQQRPRSHQACTARGTRQVTGSCCEQGPIGKLRPRDLPAQDLELVAQHQQLDVLHMQAAAATNKRTEQRPHGEVEKGERPCRRSSQPSLNGEATPILAPFTPANQGLAGPLINLKRENNTQSAPTDRKTSLDRFKTTQRLVDEPPRTGFGSHHHETSPPAGAAGARNGAVFVVAAVFHGRKEVPPTTPSNPPQEHLLRDRAHARFPA